MKKMEKMKKIEWWQLEEMPTTWWLFENAAAGEYFIAEHTRQSRKDFFRRRGYFQATEKFHSLERLMEYVEGREKETTLWCVFWDNAAEKGFVAEENCYSGNFRGSKYGGFYSLYAECASESEAQQVLDLLCGF